MRRHTEAFFKPLTAIVFVAFPSIVWASGSWWPLLVLLMLALAVGSFYGTFKVVPLVLADAAWRIGEEWRPSAAELFGIANFVVVLALLVAIGVVLRRSAGRPALSIARPTLLAFISSQIAGLVVHRTPWSELIMGSGLVILFAGGYHSHRRREFLVIGGPTAGLVLLGFALSATASTVAFGIAVAWWVVGWEWLRRRGRAAANAT